MTFYRALISVPIVAGSDEAAQDAADAYAARLKLSGRSLGHVEMVAEVDPGKPLTGARMVMEDPGFREQVPLVLIEPEAG